MNLKFSPYLSYAFTEHGALMHANVLNSPRAVQVSLQIVRTFVRLRQLLSTNAELARKLEALEKKNTINSSRSSLMQSGNSSNHRRSRNGKSPACPVCRQAGVRQGFRVEEPRLFYRVKKRKL